MGVILDFTMENFLGGGNQEEFYTTRNPIIAALGHRPTKR